MGHAFSHKPSSRVVVPTCCLCVQFLRFDGNCSNDSVRAFAATMHFVVHECNDSKHTVRALAAAVDSVAAEASVVLPVMRCGTVRGALDARVRLCGELCVPPEYALLAAHHAACALCHVNNSLQAEFWCAAC